MKTTYLLTLITLPLNISTVLFLPSAEAQSTPAASSSECIGEVPAYIAPANLAMMAYQGYLEKQGIPGYQVFAEQWNFGQIKATQIVEAAVKGCLMSNKYGIATHENYINDLTQLVDSLVEENR
jgi:hypothetical protein